MSDWKKMMASKARHGRFNGRSLADENAYFEFFGGSNQRPVDCRGVVSKICAIATQLPKVLKVTFPTLTINLFR